MVSNTDDDAYIYLTICVRMRVYSDVTNPSWTI